MIFFLLIFFIFFVLITFLTLSSIKKIFNENYSNKKIFITSFILTFIYFWLMTIFRLNNFFEIVRILYYYLGLLNFAFFISIFVLLLKVVVEKIFKNNNLKKYYKYTFLFFFFLISILSIYNFSNLNIQKFDLYSDKVDKDYKIVQISDIQYWSVDKKYLEKVINLAISQKPDFIVFTWDLIDFEWYKLQDFNIFNDVKVPIYFERWNHEFYHFPEKILSYLKQLSSVKLLLNEKVSFNNYIDLVWIDFDTREEDNYLIVADWIELNQNKFNILLYHAPEYVEYSAHKWFDLQLYGHTHWGQIWPFTILVDFIYKYWDWFFTVWNSNIYTTDWAALWGPKMRLWSQNEITVFNIIKK